jgi:hypothetical protein
MHAEANRWREAAVVAAMVGERSLDRDAAGERGGRLAEGYEKAVTEPPAGTAST